MQQIAYFFESAIDAASKIPLEGKVKCSLESLSDWVKKQLSLM